MIDKIADTKRMMNLKLIECKKGEDRRVAAVNGKLFLAKQELKA